MKHVFSNLKRFDIPKEYGGANSIAPTGEWGNYIVKSAQEAPESYKGGGVKFVMYLPELHLIPAVSALCENSPVAVGCQDVYRDDTAIGDNFEALITNRIGNTAEAIRYTMTIIGHYGERWGKAGILMETGVIDAATANRLLNQEIKATMKAGLQMLYCIGKSDQEQDRWQEVLKERLETGLDGVDESMVIVTYEPIQAIGSDKTSPGKDYITMIGIYVKGMTGNIGVVYGGDLKVDNAEVLVSIPVMDGGSIVLIRFRGGVGFYPEEYLEIIRTYMRK